MDLLRFPNFAVVPRALGGILTVGRDPQFPHVEQTFSDENLEQHNGN